MEFLSKIMKLINKDKAFIKALEVFIHEWELTNRTKVVHRISGKKGVVLAKHSYLKGTYIVQWEGGKVTNTSSANIEKLTEEKK